MNSLGDLIKLYVNIFESIETRKNFKNLKYILKKLNKNFEYNEFFTTYNISDNVRGDIYKISICEMNLDRRNYLDYTVAIYKDFNKLVYITKNIKGER
jgi:hypothetical protein